MTHGKDGLKYFGQQSWHQNQAESGKGKEVKVTKNYCKLASIH